MRLTMLIDPKLLHKILYFLLCLSLSSSSVYCPPSFSFFCCQFSAFSGLNKISKFYFLKKMRTIFDFYFFSNFSFLSFLSVPHKSKKIGGFLITNENKKNYLKKLNYCVKSARNRHGTQINSHIIC